MTSERREAITSYNELVKFIETHYFEDGKNQFSVEYQDDTTLSLHYLWGLWGQLSWFLVPFNCQLKWRISVETIPQVSEPEVKKFMNTLESMIPCIYNMNICEILRQDLLAHVDTFKALLLLRGGHHELSKVYADQAAESIYSQFPQARHCPYALLVLHEAISVYYYLKDIDSVKKNLALLHQFYPYFPVAKIWSTCLLPFALTDTKLNHSSIIHHSQTESRLSNFNKISRNSENIKNLNFVNDVSSHGFRHHGLSSNFPSFYSSYSTRSNYLMHQPAGIGFASMISQGNLDSHSWDSATDSESVLDTPNIPELEIYYPWHSRSMFFENK